MTKILDNIEQEIKIYKGSNKSLPSYIILDRDSYMLLKEEKDIPFYDELDKIAGVNILIRPSSKIKKLNLSIKTVIEKTAEELGIDYSIVEFAIKHKYDWLREQMTNMTAPAILDNYFGTYYLMHNKLRKHLEHLEEQPNSESTKDRFNKYKGYYEIVCKYQNK